MRLTLKQKLHMCEEHVIKEKSISHASEMYGVYDIGSLKYLINIYKRYGKDAFLKVSVKRNISKKADFIDFIMSL